MGALTVPHYQYPQDPYPVLAGRPQGQTIHGSQVTAKNLTLYSNKIDRTTLGNFDGAVLIDSQLQVLPTGRALTASQPSMVDIGVGSTFTSSGGVRVVRARPALSLSANQTVESVLLEADRTITTGLTSAALTDVEARSDTTQSSGSSTGVSLHAFRHTASLTAASGASIAGAMTGFQDTPAFAATGTIGLADYYSIYVLPTVSSGTPTFTRFTVLRAPDLSGLSGISTLYLIDSDSTEAHIAHAGYCLFGRTGITSTSLGRVGEFSRVYTLTTGIADGYAGGLRLWPMYDQAYTVTRHNYMEIIQPNLTNSAAVTDACVMNFNAAAGTHKALDGSSTKTTPTAVQAWMKHNVNGTIYYVPMYTSKTA